VFRNALNFGISWAVVCGRHFQLRKMQATPCPWKQYLPTPITKTLEGNASQRKQHLLRSSIFLEAAFNNECEEALHMYMDTHENIYL
jgi:hypothetical protein